MTMQYYELKGHLLIPCNPPPTDVIVTWKLIKIGNEMVSKSNNIYPTMIRSKTNLNLRKVAILSHGNL